MAVSEAVYVGLGSNLSDPEMQVRTAVHRFADIPRTVLEKCSSLYLSKPMGPRDQPDFVNAVARLATELEPLALLGWLQRIEREQGRRREGQRWGPRTLDLDLLLWGHRRIDEPDLRVPHPGLPQRDFVLYPLTELEPNLIVPGMGRLTGLLRNLDGGGLRILSPPPDAAARSSGPDVPYE